MITIGIGTNLGNRISNIKKSIELLSEQVTITKYSNLYETEPVPVSNQQWYYNCLISIKTDKNPHQLLKVLHQIEHDMGRIRTNNQNDSRIIDLDILDFNGVIINDEVLQLPHPRLTQRAFVVYPLIDINPLWADPVSGRKIDSFIPVIWKQNIRKIGDNTWHA